MLSLLPHESIETGPLHDDLLAPYTVAVRIAEVADSLAQCHQFPEATLSVLVKHLERLEIRGDVFTLLTGNAQELNSVRDRPASYWNIVYPNAHLVAYELWDRLLAQAWFLSNDLNLVANQCCADRFDFDVFHLSVLRGNERAVRDYFSGRGKFSGREKLPSAQTLLAELALEVSRVAHQRAAQVQHSVGRIQETRMRVPVPSVELQQQGGERTRRVDLRGREEGPIVLGKTKNKLTKAQYNVVKALLDAGDLGLTKDELVNKSGHEDARGILHRLSKKDDWKQVIHFAGQTGGGYRIM